MFKNLIVPVDGGDASNKALKKIAELARSDRAKITLVYVSDPLPPIAYADTTMGVPFSDAQHKKACEAFAKKLLAKCAEKLGKGLTIDARHIFHTNLFEGIIEAAKKAKGDVIVMASNKNTGLKGIMLGSETHAVIVHTNLPVLVLG
jgi:nucleotide-binding universal stress UspA family protein